MKQTIFAPFFRGLQREVGMTYSVGDAPSVALVGGRLYSRADATLLASFARPFEQFGDEWLDEELYRTIGGRLFLRVVGGPRSVHRLGGSGAGQLIPIQDHDAKRWLELRSLVTEYMAIFGQPEAA
jgi:hypothetical protein